MRTSASSPGSEMTLSPKIMVAISACLLGEPVRYDGSDKLQARLVNRLREYFELIPICPEVAIGLGVPRSPIQLVLDGASIRARGVEDNSLDVTDSLAGYGHEIASAHAEFCGYVLKARSPSCGLGTAPLFDIEGQLTGIANGVYVDAVLAVRKDLPVADEEQLRSDSSFEYFLGKVTAYSAQMINT